MILLSKLRNNLFKKCEYESFQWYFLREIVSHLWFWHFILQIVHALISNSTQSRFSALETLFLSFFRENYQRFSSWFFWSHQSVIFPVDSKILRGLGEYSLIADLGTSILRNLPPNNGQALAFRLWSGMIHTHGCRV